MSTQIEKNPLLPKIRKVLETDLDSDANLLGGLNSLSEVLPVNTIPHRRNLRSEIEKQQAGLYESFLNQFESVKQSIDALDSHIHVMQRNCEEINEQLVNMKHRSSDLLDEASSLQEHSNKCGMKIRILNYLSESFQVSSDDREILCSPDPAINADYLTALGRAQRIENNCKHLVQSGGHNFGLGLLDATHTILETAYQRLYQSVQSEFRSKTQETPEFPPILRSSLEMLLNKPALLKYALEEYANARRTTVLRMFIDALTLGVDSTSSSSRPIDLRSHDPVRYVSDILACVHQLAATENEYMKSLTHSATPCIEDFFTVSMSIIAEGLCSPLKMRLEQILVSLQDPIFLYKVNNVLRFYEHTLGTLLGSACQLLTTVTEMCELSWRLLFNCLQQYIRQTLDQSDYPSQDLSPSHAIRDTLELMVGILRSHDISLLSTNVRKASVTEITKAVVSPLLVHCQRCADRFQQTTFSNSGALGSISDKLDDNVQLSRRTKTAVYLINCYYLIQTTLAQLEFAADQIEQVAKNLDAVLENLVAVQVSVILKMVRLTNLIHVLEQGHDATRDGPLVNRSDIDSDADIRDALVQFDLYLANPDQFTLPELQFLIGQRLKKVVRRRAADEVHSRYQLIYQAITDPANGFSSTAFAENFLGIRTPQQVAELMLNL